MTAQTNPVAQSAERGTPTVVPDSMSAEEANATYGDCFGVDWTYAERHTADDLTDLTGTPLGFEADTLVLKGTNGNPSVWRCGRCNTPWSVAHSCGNPPDQYAEMVAEQATRSGRTD
jgi:hypothetical protein